MIDLAAVLKEKNGELVYEGDASSPEPLKDP